MTDQAALSDRLTKAMTRMAEAEHHISNQAALVAGLERDGKDVQRSLVILTTLREAHARFQQEVEDILKELKRNAHP